MVTDLDRGAPERLNTAGLSPDHAAEVNHLAGQDQLSDLSALSPGVQARALVGMGRYERAREVLEGLDLRSDTLQGTYAAAWAASRAGPSPAIERLRDHWSGSTVDFVTDHHLPLGPASLPVGVLAAAAGDLDQAEEHLTTSVLMGDRRGPVWGARCRLELARVLMDASFVHGSTDGTQRARRALLSARTFFDAGGYAHLGSVARRLGEAPLPEPVTTPGLGHLVPGPTPEARWTVGFGVQPAVPLDPTAGLTVLRHLVARAGSTLLAVQLSDLLDGGTGELNLPFAATTEAHDEVKNSLFDERSRSRISKLIARTVQRLGHHHPLLAAHLTRQVTTGHRCRYEPIPGVAWRLG